MAIDIGGMRKPYHEANDFFDLKDLVSMEPFGQFTAWFNEAKESPGVEEANTMCISTATADGKPSGRMVLLKKFGKDEGFVFYTNYESRKGQELISNPYASLTFYWEPLKKSIRVEGRVEKVSEEESTEYFHSRPVSSQIGACISHQSQVIASRDVLIERQKNLKAKYEDGKIIPKPDYWGGFRILPESFEFWQGQSTRIHDRLRFRKLKSGEKIDETVTKKGEEGWVIERLSP